MAHGDIWPAWKRSEVMAKIRSKGNRSTELRLVLLFKTARISGWRRHVSLPGRPDFTFRAAKVAVFVDGDFWHGRLARRPKSNASYWTAKIEGNCRRDRRNNRLLRKLGWSVLRVWEGDLKRRPEYCLARIVRKLGKPNRRSAAFPKSTSGYR
jgi:DNA mismatch endonuclease (patch repair protein)